MGTVRSFRFGVQHYSTLSRDEWQETARRAEGLGYDVFLMPDHIGQGGLAWAPALVAAANATSTLRVGTLVLANDFRHPTLVASEAATVDLLSDGRFELGLGAGWDLRDYAFAGIPFEPPGVRIARVEESLTIVKNLLTNSLVTFSGEHYAISELQNAPRSLQTPRPPVLVGAGSARMLSLAAREADIVSIMPSGIGSGRAPDLSASAMLRSVERIREAAGERFETLELNTLLQRLHVTDGRQNSAQDIADQWQMSIEEVLDSPWVLIGTVDQITETLQKRRERYGLSYWVVPGWYMEDFAPVIARLA